MCKKQQQQQRHTENKLACFDIKIQMKNGRTNKMLNESKMFCVSFFVVVFSL